MMPGMVLRDEDDDPIDAFRGLCWGLFLSLICWGLAFFAVLGLMGRL